jgi:hypothetical protein
MIQVPREMISGTMFALVPVFFLVLKVIDDPGLHGVRGVEILRLITIGFGAGIFFSGLMLRLNSKPADRTPAASDLDQNQRPTSTT